MLELVVLFPVMGIFNILIIRRDNDIILKKVALEWSLLTLTATILLWTCFDGEGPFQVFKNLE